MSPKRASQARSPGRRASKSPRRPAARRKIGRLRAGEAISLVAAILLFVLTFFDWFEAGIGSEPGSLVAISALDGGQDAWQALEVIPLFLMLAIVVAVGAALLKLGRSTWKPAIPAAATVCVLGLLAALLILIRMIWLPDLTLSEVSYPVSLKLSIFLALTAALGIAYGGWRTMGEEGTTFAGIARRLESPERSERHRAEPKRESKAPRRKRAARSKP